MEKAKSVGRRESEESEESREERGERIQKEKSRFFVEHRAQSRERGCSSDESIDFLFYVLR